LFTLVGREHPHPPRAFVCSVEGKGVVACWLQQVQGVPKYIKKLQNKVNTKNGPK